MKLGYLMQKESWRNGQRKIDKIREIYLSEVTDYWKDTADTCWARYKANHIDQLKKKLNDILIEFPLDKDVK